MSGHLGKGVDFYAQILADAGGAAAYRFGCGGGELQGERTVIVGGRRDRQCGGVPAGDIGDRLSGGDGEAVGAVGQNIADRHAGQRKLQGFGTVGVDKGGMDA